MVRTIDVFTVIFSTPHKVPPPKAKDVYLGFVTKMELKFQLS